MAAFESQQTDEAASGPNGSASGARGNGGAGQQPSSFGVANIHAGQPDGRNEIVEYVFFKRTEYAIYQCKGKVIVCYSDNTDNATAQIAKIAELIALRDKLQYLTTGTTDLSQNYRESIAEALRLGLEGKLDFAKQALEAAIEDVNQTRARKGRVTYLFCAAPAAAILAFICFMIAFKSGWAGDALIRHLFIATGAGAIGGMLSISIAISRRTVVSDGYMISNVIDALVRLMMAVISAAALYLLLSSGLLHEVQVGGAKLSGSAISGPVSFLIGFAAGFLERLLPDLLEKAGTAPNKNAAAGAGGATTGVGGNAAASAAGGKVS